MPQLFHACTCLRRSKEMERKNQEHAAELNEEPEDVPEDFFCPILSTIMIDPVTTMDGQTYERTAIATWLRPGRMNSPSTGARLPFPTLTPNHTLRKVIEDWLARHHRTQERQVPIDFVCLLRHFKILLGLEHTDQVQHVFATRECNPHGY